MSVSMVIGAILRYLSGQRAKASTSQGAAKA
jgi:hypothetical protein